jgi:S1-C subfamily serine protease
MNRLDERRVGDTVRLTVQRDGKQAELTATLKAG